MTSNVAYERSFAELSNGHGFSMVRVITLAKIIKTICSVFFFATVSSHISARERLEYLFLGKPSFTKEKTLRFFPINNMFVQNIDE